MQRSEFELLLDDMETRLDRLRALYEQYFQGIERIEPTVARKDFDRRMVVLRRARPKNTALRFRRQQLIQRYTTYVSYWRRIVRQIEEGTYRRHVDRARRRRRRAEREAEIQPSAYALQSEGVDADAALNEALQEAADATPERRPARPPGRSLPSDPWRPSGQPPPPDLGMSEPQLRSVYLRYLAARKRNNESVDKVRYESVARRIQDMMPDLRKKHAGKRIEFRVVLKNGRVALKPVAK